jgi:hypothetical protein
VPPVSHKPTGECSLCEQVARVWRFDENIEAVLEGGIVVSGSSICASCLDLVYRLAVAAD